MAVTNAAGSITLGYDYTADPATDPGLSANRVAFGSTGIVSEGSAANPSEGLLTCANPTGDRTWTLPDVSGTLLTSGTVWTQGGNSYGATGFLGTNDAFAVAFETSGSTKMTLDTSGSLTLNTAGQGIYFQGSAGATDARVYTSAADDRLFIRAESTDNVAQFASYGLYLPQDPGRCLYAGGDVQVGYASAADDDYLYMDDASQYLRWYNTEGRFEFSAPLKIGGTTNNATLGNWPGSAANTWLYLSSGNSGSPAYHDLAVGNLWVNGTIQGPAAGQFVQNQIAAAQSANWWINGRGLVRNGTSGVANFSVPEGAYQQPDAAGDGRCAVQGFIDRSVANDDTGWDYPRRGEEAAGG